MGCTGVCAIAGIEGRIGPAYTVIIGKLEIVRTAAKAHIVVGQAAGDVQLERSIGRDLIANDGVLHLPRRYYLTDVMWRSQALFWTKLTIAHDHQSLTYYLAPYPNRPNFTVMPEKPGCTGGRRAARQQLMLSETEIRFRQVFG